MDSNKTPLNREKMPDQINFPETLLEKLCCCLYQENYEARDKSENYNICRHLSRKMALLRFFLAVSVLGNVGLLTSVLVLTAQKNEQPILGPACPENWIGYEGNCYYFSKEKGNWNSSQNFCLSHNASLLTFSANQEKNFVMRLKGKDIYWIGLRRNPGQPWKWTNGVNSTLEVMGDGGDCAFLSDETTAISSRCRMELLWICRKSDILQCSNEPCKSKKA
ncbi:C-type lectin domain family 2 member D-like isoform X2 [Elgaria multicarinata webbii]|uniref:C-type lectin domain family 2 member D-like isoform X2 n=1 Tax=Elgaria multicarinata webbii TaxID=159646 RepID=UPI002FCD64FC